MTTASEKYLREISEELSGISKELHELNKKEFAKPLDSHEVAERVSNLLQENVQELLSRGQ